MPPKLAIPIKVPAIEFVALSNVVDENPFFAGFEDICKVAVYEVPGIYAPTGLNPASTSVKLFSVVPSKTDPE